MRRVDTGVRSRGWVFTINNYDEADMFQLEALAGVLQRSKNYAGGPHLDYLIFAFECGEQGTWHIQGYCFFKNVIRRKQMSRYLKTAYVAPAKGTPEQNYDYVTKDGNFLEWGSLPTKGRLTWDKIVEVMKDPKSNPSLYNQYRKGI